MIDSFHPAVEVPVLETERLRLRGHRVGDLVHCAGMWAEPEVVRHTRPQGAYGRRELAEIVELCGPLGADGVRVLGGGGEGNGQVCRRNWVCGLQAGSGAVGWRACRRGWVLAAHAHGKGYATEAVRAALAWGDEHFQPARTACIIVPENLQSIRVAAKCGYEEFARTTYKGHSVLMFVREPAGR